VPKNKPKRSARARSLDIVAACIGDRRSVRHAAAFGAQLKDVRAARAAPLHVGVLEAARAHARREDAPHCGILAKACLSYTNLKDPANGTN